jgi:hypothetical protein
VGWAGYVAYIANEKINIIFWPENLEGRGGFGNAGAAGTIILKWTLKLRDSEFDPTGSG